MKNYNKYDDKPFLINQQLTGISDKTISIHRDKLYKGYVNKMNEVVEKLSKFATGEKELASNQTYSELRGLRMGETFANNGVYLHEYYFNSLGGEGVISDNALTKAISEKWGSVEQFIKYFSASGMAMRGWVILCWDTQVQRLKVYGADSHNQGGVWGCLPIIVLDVYEHAYYLDYGSDRKTYIIDFWKNLNWDNANKIFTKIVK